jgi:class 3 adenylate cyclase/TolB-like protein/cytochrome c-type biogenesis protein CcmH/NrfG
MPAVRRLAAILAADVAGYSRLMGADEEGTHERLRALRRELVDLEIGEHSGRVVKNTGDGLLAEFASVVDAVRCAAELQRAMIDREAGRPEDSRIRFRIGINLGDVIVEQGDIFGDGVNVAARLEALAEPGGICISRMVRDQIRDKLPYAFEDLGEQSVKNIARPVRAYALRPQAIAELPAASVPSMPPDSQLAVAPRLSIVVLPFTNLSNDPEQEYFADGITDDLTSDLSRISGSFVIARTTAFAYKGKPVDVRRIGRELGVRYVLEGSVRRLGDRVQVNVQLIEAESGAHAWADRFDTDRRDVVEAQSEIIGRLARSLNFELLRDAGRRIDEEKAADPDARDRVMRAWSLYYGPGFPENQKEAVREFERALEIDPRLIDAKLGIARALVGIVGDGLSNDAQRDQARVEQLLGEVLEREPNRSLAHAVLGHQRRIQGRMAEAQAELEAAIALDRNDAWAIRTLGQTFLGLGQPGAAIPYFEAAIKLNPREPSVGNAYGLLGVSHLYLGNTEQAIAFLRKARTEMPRYWEHHGRLASALGLKGDIGEAQAEIAEMLKLKPEVTSAARWRAIRTTMGGGNPRSQALWEKTIVAGLRCAGFPEE